MKKIFESVAQLDKNCYTDYNLNEDILMEHAGSAIYNYIKKKFKKSKKILIVCGTGNNGADGLVLARLLYGRYDTTTYLSGFMKTGIGKLQAIRLAKLGVQTIDKLPADMQFDVVVDCLFGSGLSRKLDEKYMAILKQLNDTKAHKIACDIPSGLDNTGRPRPICFTADTTVAMGALKLSLFADISKDSIGKVIVANLGIDRTIYEKETNCFLLDKKDMKLPYRTLANTHKVSLGHLAVVCGEKVGAGKLCAMSAINFACGMVTAISKDHIANLDDNLMQNSSLPQTTTAIAIGMGLGSYYDKTLLENDLPKILDADIFYDKNISALLTQQNIVLTPHPKEFVSLLSLCGICDIDTDTLQDDRVRYCKLFSETYPHIVLLLKGANHIIAYDSKFYINPHGTNILSTAGSGDVLSGLIGSALAYGLSPFDATVLGSLAHTSLANKFRHGSFTVKATDLIKKIRKL